MDVAKAMIDAGIDAVEVLGNDRPVDEEDLKQRVLH